MKTFLNIGSYLIYQHVLLLLQYKHIINDRGVLDAVINTGKRPLNQQQISDTYLYEGQPLLIQYCDS